MRKIYNAAAVLTAAAALLTGCSDQAEYSDESSSIAEAVTSAPQTTSTPQENSVPEETTSHSGFLNDLIKGVREKEPPESRPQSSGSGKLTILCWNSKAETQNMVDAFLEYNGYSSDLVEVVSFDVNGSQIYDEYKNYIAGDNDVDLFVISCDEILTFVYDESITKPLSELGLSRADFPNAYEYTLDLCTNDSGELRALCYNACPGAFVYRADLAREYLGVNSPEEMQNLIGSWESFQQTGTRLIAASGGKTALQSSLNGMWQAYKCGKTQPWVMNGEKLTLGGCIPFYEMAKSMKANGSLADISIWDTEWFNSIYTGAALGEFLPSWGLGFEEGTVLTRFAHSFQGSDDTAELAICQGPSAWYWGGAYLGVSQKCNDPELAKEFLEFMCADDDAMDYYYYEKTGSDGFCNNSAVIGGYYNYNSLLADSQDINPILDDQARNIHIAGTVTKYDDMLDEMFLQSVRDYVNGDARDINEAAQSFIDSALAAYPWLTTSE